MSIIKNNFNSTLATKYDYFFYNIKIVYSYEKLDYYKLKLSFYL